MEFLFWERISLLKDLNNIVRVILIGAVNSTLETLRKLVFHEFDIALVFGYRIRENEIISGYVDMSDYCNQMGIPFKYFDSINSEDNIQFLEEVKPDLIFAVGLSQLVCPKILEIPKLGCIGFHPTLLPRGRGRAPIAWLILEEKFGAANFFLIGKGVDDGPIFVQQKFEIEDADDAEIIEQKILMSIGLALDSWLPDLKKGLWNPIEQNGDLATYFEKRTADDGWIDWHLDMYSVDRLIKATSKPHPGAYTFLNHRRIVVLKSRIENTLKIKGVPGRVLRVNDKNEYLIQCGMGLLWLSEIEDSDGKTFVAKVGQKFGYYVENEIFILKEQIKRLNKLIDNQ